jgi:ATP-binding cassette subfamily B protein
VTTARGDAAASAPEAGSGRHAYRWLLGFVRPHGRRLAVVLLLSLLATALGLAQPYLTKLLIDDGLIAGQFAVIVGLCGAMVGIGLAAAALGGLNRWHYIALSGKVLFALREAVYRHLQRLSPAYYAATRQGDLLARLDGDVGEIQRIAVDMPLAFVNGVIALLGSVGIMLWLDWRLALIAFLVLPCEVLFLHWVRPVIERRTRRLRERASDITGFLVDTLGAMKFIQSVRAEAREARRFEDLNAGYLGDLLRLQMTNFAAASVPNLMMTGATAGVFVVGGYWLIQGQLSLGTLIAFSVYLGRAAGPVQTILGLYVALARAKVSIARVQEITFARPAVASPARPRALPPTAGGEIRFEQVTFGYPDSGGQPQLDRVDLRVPAGAGVGVVGPSGIGKTTLIDLLARHYDPDAGRILLDGVDLRELALESVREKIAVVAQDTALLPGSIAENIRYARPAATDDEVQEAARRAQVAGFAQVLPAGLDTQVGSRGLALSGGQRQRIAIARALLLEPLVLVLDEATSSVDRRSEAQIIEAVHGLFAGRTRIIVSHRRETLAGLDAVFTLSGSALVPLGEGQDEVGQP